MAGVSGLGTPWRLHAVAPRSAANGPGVRYVVWSQGCALRCPGCFNPKTHSGAGAGTVRTAGEVAEEALAAIETESASEVDAATAAAKAGPMPAAELVEKDVWADGGASWRN